MLLEFQEQKDLGFQHLVVEHLHPEQSAVGSHIHLDLKE
jgi:hypothetical protein